MNRIEADKTVLAAVFPIAFQRRDCVTIDNDETSGQSALIELADEKPSTRFDGLTASADEHERVRQFFGAEDEGSLIAEADLSAVAQAPEFETRSNPPEIPFPT